jgi:AbrB-like transcriptional regulator
MSNTKTIEPLVGEELLQKVKELGNVSREEKARECGYYTETKNGVERVNMMKFLNALLDADGVQLIGAAYTKQMGLKEGDVFEISLGRKHIHLKQVDGNGDEK